MLTKVDLSIKKHIIIIDDDPTIRYMSRISLEQAGYEVIDCENGESGLKCITSISPDAILLDVDLPGIDGFQVCEIIRSYPQCKHIPIMMLTGLKDIDSINKAYKSGATDFQTKPINWSLLPHRVKYMIRYKDAFTELHHSRLRLFNAKYVANISDWEYNLETNKIYWSKELFSLLGHDSELRVSNHRHILRYVLEEDRFVVEAAINDLFEKYLDYDIEYRIVNHEKKLIYVQERAQVINNSGGLPEYLLGTIQNITKRKIAEEEVHYLAYYDNLTGLANRALFTEHLRKSIEKAKRTSKSIAVLFLDLDNFKRINDSMGHDSGDVLLKEVSFILQQCLRNYDVTLKDTYADIAPIARFGGDEFIILLEDVSVANVTHTAQRLLEALCPGVKINYQDVPLSASIGIAFYPDNGLDPSNLLKNADAAMYRAKEEGKNNFRFYDRSMNELALRKLQMERDLQSAIGSNELRLVYQPIVSTNEKHIVGAESLIRWQHPTLGLITPADFIPMAEENHLIKKIGRWVIETACNQLKIWHSKGYTDLYLSVNLSAGDFSDSTLVSFIRNAIKDARIPPECLMLELTERMLMENLGHTLDILTALKKIGVKLAIDDFGTGYSSLRYLSQFPLDSLKIDQSFIANLPYNKSDAMITEAIIGLAHSLEMDVIAEGIETKEQKDFLRAKACHLMQGHYFSQAISQDEFTIFIQQDKKRRIQKKTTRSDAKKTSVT